MKCTNNFLKKNVTKMIYTFRAYDKNNGLVYDKNKNHPIYILYTCSSV